MPTTPQPLPGVPGKSGKLSVSCEVWRRGGQKWGKQCSRMLPGTGTKARDCGEDSRTGMELPAAAQGLGLCLSGPSVAMSL